MCKCGCGTCETKITGPLLTEGKVKSLLSEGLNHHISNAIPLHETVYRYGSIKHLSLIKEARKLYSRNIIDLNEFDAELVKTHLGEWGLFENESVPLDLPMMNEALKTGTYAGRKVIVHMDGAETDWEVEFENGKKVSYIDVMANLKFDDGTTYMDYLKEQVVFDNEPPLLKAKIAAEDFMREYRTTLRRVEGNFGREAAEEFKEIILRKFSQMNEAFSGFLRNPEDPDSKPFEPTGSLSQFEEDLKALFGKFKGDLKNPDFIRGVAQIMVNWKSLLRSQLDEKKKAKAKKKDPPIGKPKRGGSKAYYVYVRDPKTKRIKKVSFGSGGLRAKINNPKARRAFAARHKCSQKNDRTKASYWSCRLPRYAKALGLGNNKNTFW